MIPALKSPGWWCGFSIAWAGLVLTLSPAAHHIQRLPPGAATVLAVPVLGITGALISAHLFALVVAWKRSEKPTALLPSLLLVPLLFTSLVVAVHSLLGADHFHCSTTPGLEDWFAFVGAHFLRGADTLDAIEKAGLSIQAIRHNSPLTSGLLVGLHLANGLLVLALLGRLLQQLKRSLIGDTDKALSAILLAVIVGFVDVTLVGGVLLAGALSLASVAAGRAPIGYGWFWAKCAGALIGMAVITFFTVRYVRRVSRSSANTVFVKVGLTSDPAGANKPSESVFPTIGFLLVCLVGFTACYVFLQVVSIAIGKHGSQAVTTWAFGNVLHACDLSDVIILFELEPPAWRLQFVWEPACALMIRGLTTVLLSALVVQAAQLFQAAKPEDQERLAVSVAGWKGLVGGAVAAAAFVTAAHLVFHG